MLKHHKYVETLLWNRLPIIYFNRLIASSPPELIFLTCRQPTENLLTAEDATIRSPLNQSLLGGGLACLEPVPDSR